MSVRNTSNYSPLQHQRLHYKPPLPKTLTKPYKFVFGEKTTAAANSEEVAKLFKSTYGQPVIDVVPNPSGSKAGSGQQLKVGVVLSGGQAPGGHNVISGLLDFILQNNPSSELYGFLDGPKGIFTGKYKLLTPEYVHMFRNQGGFDIIGSGRDKIEKPAEFENSQKVCEKLGLNGLIVIGGDDSNTNAALLGEYFQAHGAKTKVIGCPKTIDGDLRNDMVETSFGFDSACKLFAEMTGNIMYDCISSGKYYHFIRLMGREASNITLEVALNTHPNYTLIGEEIREQKTTLQQIAHRLADLICERHQRGKDFGVILVPEGLLEFVPEVSALIHQINDLLASGLKPEQVADKLAPAEKAVFDFIPQDIRAQLLAERDPHGNVNVSTIETEVLLIDIIQTELAKRKEKGAYKGKFVPQAHFLGYEGRSGLPSNFDSNYCYALGYNAGVLIDGGANGYMSILRGLTGPSSEWRPGGAPLTMMMNLERRKGKNKPVIKKALVDLKSGVYQAFVQQRASWELNDVYLNPGPIQFQGAGANSTNYTLRNGAPDPEYEHDLKEHKGSADSLLQRIRRRDFPVIPDILQQPDKTAIRVHDIRLVGHIADQTKEEFPLSLAHVKPVELCVRPSSAEKRALRVGLVFCGRQCSGADNIVVGLYNFLTKYHPSSVLLGFNKGTKGLFKGDAIVIDEKTVMHHLNQGGLHILGRSVDKIREQEELDAVLSVCAKLQLDGLVLVGSNITLADSARLTEYFLAKKSPTRIIGVPLGTLHNKHIEAGVGFDTTSKVYSNLVGNIAIDCNSAKKYWFFLRIMGRQWSHVTLEVALQTHPQCVILGEEVRARRWSLQDVTRHLCDVIQHRANTGKDYGIVLIPEGLPVQIAEIEILIREITALLSRGVKRNQIRGGLSSWSGALFDSLPLFFQQQLCLPRESNGGVQLSAIEMDRLLTVLCEREIAQRKKAKEFKGSFKVIRHFLGYQARSAIPSVLDCSLGVSMGGAAGGLIAAGLTGLCATAHHLTRPANEWEIGGFPLAALVEVDRSSLFGQKTTIQIASSGVDLQGPAYLSLVSSRSRWLDDDCRCNPGPVQFDRSNPVTSLTHLTLALERSGPSAKLREVEGLMRNIIAVLRPGCAPSMVDIALLQLQTLDKLLSPALFSKL